MKLNEIQVFDKGKLTEPTAKHIKLFKQIKKDMGKKKINHKNVEKMLKEIGMPGNMAVKMAVDFMNWIEDKKRQ